MIPITKRAILFWTWVTLVSCNSYNQPINFTDELWKLVLSQKEIFFDPLNKQPVPPISQSAVTSTKIRGSKNVYGSLPCSCGSYTCSCCVDIKIKPLNSEDNGCVMISPSSIDNSSLDTEILLNNKTMAQARLSYLLPPPLCIPFIPFPIISLCAKVNNMRRNGLNVEACMNIDVQVTATFIPIWTIKFMCMRFGFSGIKFFWPPTSTSAPVETETTVIP